VLGGNLGMGEAGIGWVRAWDAFYEFCCRGSGEKPVLLVSFLLLGMWLIYLLRYSLSFLVFSLLFFVFFCCASLLRFFCMGYGFVQWVRSFCIFLSLLFGLVRCELLHRYGFSWRWELWG